MVHKTSNGLNEKEEPMGFERIYKEFAIFFFSTLFLFIGLIFFSVSDKNHYFTYFAQGFTIIFFFGYTYLIGRFIEHYLNKTVDFFKKHYPQYKLWYWLIVGLLMLITLFIIGYYKLERQNFWNTLITTLLVGVLGLIGWILKKIYEKYFKKQDEATSK